MGVLEMAATRLGGSVVRGLRDLDARHPWSRNDHVHGWASPGCQHSGGGRLASVAAEASCSPCSERGARFAEAEGTDIDEEMRAVATARTTGLPDG